MKSLVLALFGALALTAPACGADEKIDPTDYICAELVAANVDGQPPLFQGLQIDGYAAAKSGRTVADPVTMAPMLIMVSDSCEAKPTEKVLKHWQEARKQIPAHTDGPWQADKTTCAAYNANPDDGSGFAIWLDGYWRGKTGKKSSIFASQETVDAFEAACKKDPAKLVYDVIGEVAK